jgi:RNA-directed DNA polymerase
VSGSREDAEALRDEVTSVLAPMGLRLSEEKTKVCHIDEGFDFLGFVCHER